MKTSLASKLKRSQEQTGAVLVRLDARKIQFDVGHAVICELPPELPPGGTDARSLRARVRLFENGREIGPGNAQHEDIRNLGGGRFSHWNRAIHFSASDNSSPHENKKNYHVLFPAGMFAPDDERLSLGLESFALDKKSPMEVFEIARIFFRRIWRDVPLPDHGRLIEQDVAFAREFHRVSAESDVTFDRKYALDQLFQLTLGVEGDVAECGTYKGGSAFFMARRIIKHGLDKRLCLFDSFGGLSAPASIDGTYWHEGALPSTIDDVRVALAPLGPTPFVEFYQGWIPGRFGDVADRSFCFVHIDVDLHAPSMDSIRFFYPRMREGGVILLDDYGFLSCPGVTKAVDQFMADKPEPIINLPSGGAFIVKKANAPR